MVFIVLVLDCTKIIDDISQLFVHIYQPLPTIMCVSKLGEKKTHAILGGPELLPL